MLYSNTFTDYVYLAIYYKQCELVPALLRRNGYIVIMQSIDTYYYGQSGC